MKKLISALFVLSVCYSSYAQESLAEQEVEKVIETFFEGFHARDSMLMKSVVNDKVVMQSISKNSEGEIRLNHEDFNKFLSSVVTIPSNINFREELHSFSIKVDGSMANVWTPYSLFVNDTFRHCGVNNFQLFKKDDKWQIIYLVDTRRTEDCDQKKLR